MKEAINKAVAEIEKAINEGVVHLSI